MNPQMFANMWHPSMMAGMPFDPTGAMLMQNKLVVKPKKRGGGPQNSPIKIKHKTWTEWKYYRSHQAAVDDNDELLCLGHSLMLVCLPPQDLVLRNDLCLLDSLLLDYLRLLRKFNLLFFFFLSFHFLLDLFKDAFLLLI